MTAPATPADESETPRELAQRVIDTWGDGNPPIVVLARALLSSPSVESVRREALEEAAAICNAAFTDPEWHPLMRGAADRLYHAIRALPALPGEDKQARG